MKIKIPHFKTGMKVTCEAEFLVTPVDNIYLLSRRDSDRLRAAMMRVAVVLYCSSLLSLSFRQCRTVRCPCKFSFHTLYLCTHCTHLIMYSCSQAVWPAVLTAAVLTAAVFTVYVWPAKFTLGADHFTWRAWPQSGRGYCVSTFSQYGCRWCGGVVHLCLCVVWSHGRPGTDASGAEERRSHSPRSVCTILWRPGESSLHIRHSLVPRPHPHGEGLVTTGWFLGLY